MITRNASDDHMLDLAGGAAVAVMIGLAVGVALQGKAGPLPVHFGLDGAPDRYGDRYELAKAIGLMAALAAVIGVFCRMMETRGQESWRAGLRLARGVMAAAFVCVAVMLAGLGFGWTLGGGGALAWTMAGVSAMLLVTGLFVGKARPNPIFGVRTYWSLTSRLAWDKSNRLAGRLFSLAGVAGLAAAPFAPQPLGLHGLIVALLIIAVVSVGESWRVWLRDPERRS